MRNKKDMLTGGVLAVVAIAYIMGSFSIKVFEGAGKTIINAGTIPRMWGVCLLILSMILIFRKGDPAVMEEKDMAGEAKHTVNEWFYQNYAVVGTFVMMVVYILILDTVGYLLDTFVYLILQILLLSPKGEKKMFLTIVISAFVAAGTCYIFTQWLGVPLPAGVLTL